MLSAIALAHHIEAALAAGCDAQIAKPITAQKLIEGVVGLMSDAGPAELASQRSG